MGESKTDYINPLVGSSEDSPWCFNRPKPEVSRCLHLSPPHPPLPWTFGWATDVHPCWALHHWRCCSKHFVSHPRSLSGVVRNPARPDRTQDGPAVPQLDRSDQRSETASVRSGMRQHGLFNPKPCNICRILVKEKNTAPKSGT